MADFPVTNHDLAVVTKGTPHVAVNTKPDVCKLPNGTPKPFPNHVESKRLAAGQTTHTFIASQPIWTKIGHLGPPSEPAHEGVKGGLVSGTYCADAIPVTCSPDLFAEGEPVVRTSDTTLQNSYNTNGIVVHTTFYFGLFDPEAMVAFCKALQQIKAKWKSMTPKQRADALKAAINERLEAAGARPVDFEVEPLTGGENGHFDWTEWSMTINEDLLSSDISDAQLASLGGTIYHEARHAEQWWYAARHVASQSQIPAYGPVPGSEVSSYFATLGYSTTRLTLPPYNYPLGVAFAATRNPLGAGQGPEGYMGTVVHQSVFGSDAAARGQTLTDLRRWGNEYAQLKAAFDKSEAFVGPLTTQQLKEKLVLIEDMNKARNELTTVYPKYRALPEEKDAWDVGNAFQASC